MARKRRYTKMKEDEALKRDRNVLVKNGFKIIGIKLADGSEGPFNLGFPPRTWTVGNDDIIVTDAEGIAWRSRKGRYKDPEVYGLIGYKYCSPSYIINPYAVK